MSGVRLVVPFAASLLVIVFGSVWLGALGNGPLSLPGKVVVAVGLAGLVWSTIRAVAAFRDRADPYDLNRLWDAPPPEPETPDRDAEDDALVLCHRCGASMPAHVGVCLECGNRLGY